MPQASRSIQFGPGQAGAVSLLQLWCCPMWVSWERCRSDMITGAALASGNDRKDRMQGNLGIGGLIWLL